MNQAEEADRGTSAAAGLHPAGRRAARRASHRQLLELKDGRELVALICRFHGYDLRQLRYYTFSNSHSGAIALLRAMFVAGSTREEVFPILKLINQLESWCRWHSKPSCCHSMRPCSSALIPSGRANSPTSRPHVRQPQGRREYLPVVDWAVERLQIDPKPGAGPVHGVGRYCPPARRP